MQFLVKVTSEVPPDFPEAERKRLLDAEVHAVKQMREQGKLTAVWKVPLANQSITVWEVEDPTELHQLLMSLPAMPWATATVLPLVPRNLSKPH